MQILSTRPHPTRGGGFPVIDLVIFIEFGKGLCNPFSEVNKSCAKLT